MNGARVGHGRDGCGCEIPVSGDDHDCFGAGKLLAESLPGLGVAVLFERVHGVAVADEQDGHLRHNASLAGNRNPACRVIIAILLWGGGLCSLWNGRAMIGCAVRRSLLALRPPAVLSNNKEETS